MHKKKLLIACVAIVAAAVVTINITLSNTKTSMPTDLQLANIETLASGEANATSCLGLWGSCTLSDGSTSKVPLVHVDF